jgi:hypothetical protein
MKPPTIYFFCKCLESRLHLLIASKCWFSINHRIFKRNSLLIGAEQSFESENTCNIFMNEVKMEDEPLQKPKENANVQIEGSRNLETNEEKTKENLKKLHA